MTGQPADQDRHHNDKEKGQGWDERTRALASQLEALLEQHRAHQQQGGGEPAPPLRKPPRAPG